MLHGGIQSHHLLNRADWPAISNLFGLLVLPALGWRLGFRLGNPGKAAKHRHQTVVGLGFFAALIYGASLATAFAFDAAELSSMLFLALPLLALLLPLQRAEFALGFTAGMSLVFGAVLPCLIALLVGLWSWVVSALLRLLWRKLSVSESTRA